MVYSRHFIALLLLSASMLITSCSTNPATGQNQFTGLMPASQEASVGASEHQKIINEFGVYNDPKVTNYVQKVGQSIVPFTERKDVNYTFTVLDSPVINAFALPGGYVYVTRGLLAWANNEAELAGVIAHEIGHVTARHSAARYSQGVVAQVGLQILGAVSNTAAVSQAANLGTNLYMSQYSQSQEHEADSLGVRYLARAGYDTKAMATFLQQLNREGAYAGKTGRASVSDFFSSHPSTPARVSRAMNEALAAGVTNPIVNDIEYLQKIDGMPYGNSADQGVVRGQSFLHAKLGIGFDAPSGYALQNTDKAVIAKNNQGITMVFDMDKKGGESIDTYLFQSMSKGSATNLEPLNINGMAAATGVIPNAQLNGTPVIIRAVAIDGGNGTVYRFQYAMPQSLAGNASVENAIQASAKSFRKLNATEIASAQAQRISVVAAAVGDTVDTMAARMSGASSNAKALFMALNGMDNAQALQPGRLYKVIR